MNKRVKDYQIKELNPPRPNKKLLVLDIDYTLFDHRSVAEGGKFLNERTLLKTVTVVPFHCLYKTKNHSAELKQRFPYSRRTYASIPTRISNIGLRTLRYCHLVGNRYDVDRRENENVGCRYTSRL